MGALAPVTVLLGGARSGKSRRAEAMIEAGLAAGAYRGGIYLATAEGRDEEMRQRIDAHRARRGAGWTTVEEPLALAAALDTHSAVDTAILVDCLTLWLSNVMAAGRDPGQETDGLLAALAKAAGPVVLVGNEVGSGIVPMNKLARDFRDAAGLLNQRVAGAADAAALIVAGLPLALKGQHWFAEEDR